MIRRYFQAIRIYVSIIHDKMAVHGLIKLDDKVILKILRCSSTIAGIITNNLIFFWYNLDERTFVESVNDNIRTISLRKSKVEHDSPLRRTELRRDIVIRQKYTIIIWLCDFCFMGEPTRSCILVKHRLPRYRHQRKLSVIVIPRTRLV